MSEILSKDDILGADDIEIRDVTVQGWPRKGQTGIVRVRGLDGTGRDAFESSQTVTEVNEDGTFQTLPDTTNVRAKLLVRCIVDANGNLMFAERDIPALGLKSAAVLNQLFEVAAELSGLGKKAEDAAGKDSAPAPSDSSTSTGPTQPE